MNYAVFEPALKLFSDEKIKIKNLIQELENCNENYDETNLIHIFVDNNRFSESRNKLISKLESYIGSYIKFYIVEEEITTYTKEIYVTKENLNNIKEILNLEQSVVMPKISREDLNKFIVQNNIKKYNLFIFNICYI